MDHKDQKKSRLEALRAQRLAAEAEARAAELTQEERDEQVELDAIATAKEDKAAAETVRRSIKLASRVDVAKTKAGTAYLVAGVDVVACFPLGDAPPGEQLPPDGVVVVRNPTPKESDDFAREIEAKKKNVSAIAVELAVACTVDPSGEGAEGVRLRGFYEKFPEAAGAVAMRARDLGGAKSAADKRGRG